MEIKEAEKMFTEIYERESDSIFRYAFLRTSNREQALDIVQDTFIRLWKALMTQKQINHPKAFLFTITRNLIIDWYRKKKSLSIESVFGDGDDNDNSSSYLVDSTSYKRIQFSAEIREVIDVIGEMEPQYQEILYLRLIEDMLPQEIAKLLKITPNLASVRITRGMDELRKKLGVISPSK